MTFLLKILLFFYRGGVVVGASAKSYSSHSILLHRPGPAAREGRSQHCWLGPDRGTDPQKDIFVCFKVLRWQKAQRSTLSLMKSKLTPNVIVGRKSTRSSSRSQWAKYKFSGFDTALLQSVCLLL